jgi:hypothetical protein
MGSHVGSSFRGASTPNVVVDFSLVYRFAFAEIFPRSQSMRESNTYTTPYCRANVTTKRFLNVKPRINDKGKFNTVCKEKGITLHYPNSKNVKFGQKNTFTRLGNKVQPMIVMYGANITTPISFEIHYYTVEAGTNVNNRARYSGRSRGS